MSQDGAREKLRGEVLQVLDGAEDVRKKLDALLSLGSPVSIRDVSYAVKSRVKQQNSAMDKIYDRRANGKPDYAATDLRDIVGVRAVTLFDADKAEVLRLVLQMITTASHPGIGLFALEPIEEIKLYHVPTAGAAESKEMILMTLANAGYNTTMSTPLVQVEEKNSRYSSIHLILRCIGNGSKGPAAVPVEFQIRSAFEDVWGEIDHSLQYKFKKSGGDNPLITPIATSASQQIKILKDQMQTAASVADIIRTLLGSISGSQLDRIEPGTSLGGTRQFTLRQNINSALRQAVLNAVELQDKALRLEREVMSEMGREDYRRALQSAIEAWARVEKEMSTSSPNDPNLREELSYHVKMDEALCHFYMARNGLTSNPPPVVEGGGERNEHLLVALRMYRELVQSPRFSTRAVLHFRLAQVMARFFSSLEPALESISKAEECLKQDQTVPENNWLRVRIPRFQSYLLWEAAESIRRQGQEVGDDNFNQDKKLAFYLQAVDAALKAAKQDFTMLEIESNAWSQAREQSLAINNLVSTSLDYLRNGGVRAELTERGIDTTSFSKMAEKILLDDGLPPRAKVDLLDTLRDLYSFIGESRKVSECADMILALTRGGMLNEGKSDLHLEEIVKNAKLALSEADSN
jgi:ppGpp synthetase/RelA/SpoT-type nucleotidyltranferase